ncbi:MAG: AraC family ligand binding domain-containing protein [Acidihalobacter sp.]
MSPRDWIDLSQDSETGIETLRAHFEGHAYDPHWHDSYLIGVTEQGVQQFNCRRQRHSSTRGKVFMLEPGEIHDGEAPEDASFTYSSLYIDPQWLMRELRLVYGEVPCGYERVCRRLLCGRGTICMRIWPRTSGWTIWPGWWAPTVSG